MQRERRSITQTLRNFFGSRATRKARQRWGRRFEPLEPRLMMHAHNGPYTSDPGYNLSSFHIHAQLSIYVDSQLVTIPQGIGAPASGAASIHTHDATGKIHIHPTSPVTEFITLEDVFDAWKARPATGSPTTIELSDNQIFNRFTDNTHTLQMFVNGQEVFEEFADYQIHDEDSIVLVYGTNPVISVQTNLTRDIPANAASGLPAHTVPIAYPIELLRDITPNTVTNFLNYVNDGDYTNSIFHRLVSGFVIQGGGFESASPTFTNSDLLTAVPTDPQIQNEFDNYIVAEGTGATVTQGNTTIQLPAADLSDVIAGDRIRIGTRTDGISGSAFFNITSVDDVNNRVVVSQAPSAASATNQSWVIAPPVNVPRTIAMAKLGSSPNSATSQFFVNLGDNTLNLDAQNGGFTVFAQVLDPLVLTDVVDLDDSAILNGTLTGAQEVPSVTTTATGEVELTYSRDAQTFDITATFTGITQANITDMHLHVGPTGQDGAVIVDLLARNPQFTAATGGGLTFTLRNVPLPAANVNDLIGTNSFTGAPLNRTYLNIHTTQHPDGEIRAQMLNGVFSNIPLEGTSPNRQLVRINSIVGDGTVSGLVYNDLDRDGVRDTGEAGLQGRVIFSDADNDAVLDPTEVSATTDANGVYVLRLAPGQHRIRQVPVAQTIITAPTNPASFSINVEIGSENTDVRFGNFTVPTLTGVDLLAVTDSGVNTDNITNFNNSTAGKALQFSVGNVQNGAIVRLFSDGVLIGQTTATGATATITTNGTTTLAEGARSIIATQEIGGVQSVATTPLSITVDTTLPGTFTSTPPTTAIIGQNINYDATVTGEGTGITYSLTNAPTGATINASSGLLSWTPTVAQTGTAQFQIVASDVAGNTRSQPLTVGVGKEPKVGATFKITTTADPNSAELTEVNVGDVFFLQVSVADLRNPARGVFTFFEDVLFEQNLAEATAPTGGQAITYSANFPNTRSGSVQPGLIDEVGGVNFDSAGLGPGSFPIYTVRFTAKRSGTIHFSGEAPDTFPAHDILVLGSNTPVPLDEIAYGATQLTVNAGFGAQNDVFNFDEDTSNNNLDVLANDATLSGQPGNFTITAFNPLPGQTIAGTVTIAADQKSLRYTPTGNFNGETRFTYSVTDGSDTLTATVTVTVQPVNDAPTATNDTFASLQEDSTSNFLDVLSNDSIAPDAGETLVIASVGTTSNGGVVTIGPANNHLLYTPAANFQGTETFTYTIRDRATGGLTSTGTVTVTLQGSNDNPTAVNDNLTANEDSASNSFDVLANDSALPDTGETLTLTGASNTNRGGTVALGQNGTRVIYTPAANFQGTETFTYTVSDGHGGTATGTATVTVTNTNDPPTATNDSLFVTKLTTNNPINVLQNDLFSPDPQETLTVTAVGTTGTRGTVTVGTGGTNVIYTPPTTFPGGAATGTDTFTYTIRDPGGLESTATVTVNVVDFIPSSLAGNVYLDTDNDGEKDTGEEGQSGSTRNLTGTDSVERAGARSTSTDSAGAYIFNNLAPGTYTIIETQPTGQRNGVPIVDGKDTVGSQGGTSTTNDRIQITLAQNINGTGNNYGELLGRTLSGTVADSAIAAGRGVFGGIGLNVLDSSGNVMRNVTSTAGNFSVPGLPAGQYRITTATPAFLISNAGESAFTANVSNTDSIGNLLVLRGRQAPYVSLRDISSLAPQEFLQVVVGPSGNQWYLLGPGWTGFSDASFSLTNNSSTLHIEMKTTDNRTLAGNIALNDPRVRLLGTQGDLRLFEINSNSAGLNLTQVAAGNAEGEAPAIISAVPQAEGEGSTVSSFSNITLSSASDNHDHDGHDHSHAVTLTTLPTLSTTLAAPPISTLSSAVSSFDVVANVNTAVLSLPTTFQTFGTTTETTDLVTAKSVASDSPDVSDEVRADLLNQVLEESMFDDELPDFGSSLRLSGGHDDDETLSDHHAVDQVMEDAEALLAGVE